MTDLLFHKEYDGESIIDIEQDVMEAICEADVPADEHGIQQGTFTVKIEWDFESPEEQAEAEFG